MLHSVRILPSAELGLNIERFANLLRYLAVLSFYVIPHSKSLTPYINPRRTAGLNRTSFIDFQSSPQTFQLAITTDS